MNAGAQHHPATATRQHEATAPAASPVAALAAELELTSQQTAEIDRLATEACAAMAKYHEQILAVLTPEQRAKLLELHGGRRQTVGRRLMTASMSVIADAAPTSARS